MNASTKRYFEALETLRKALFEKFPDDFVAQADFLTWVTTQLPTILLYEGTTIPAPKKE